MSEKIHFKDNIFYELCFLLSLYNILVINEMCNIDDKRGLIIRTLLFVIKNRLSINEILHIIDELEKPDIQFSKYSMYI